LPSLLRGLLEGPAIASDEAASLVRQGILTLADLQAALDDERIRTRAGARKTAGEALDARLRPAAGALELEARLIPLGRAWEIATTFVDEAARACPAIELFIAAGDVRRCEPLVSSIVVVGRASDPPGAIDALSGTSTVDHVLHRSGRRAILLTGQGELDVRGRGARRIRHGALHGDRLARPPARHAATQGPAEARRA
jgi:DNA polymerase/3'-5' exonuclease PolX